MRVPYLLTLVLAVSCTVTTAVKKRKRLVKDESANKRNINNGWVELSEFDKTMDGKVMPTGKVPEGILDVYPTSSKLVTLKRSVRVEVPALDEQNPYILTADYGRYDTVETLMETISEKIGFPTQETWSLVSRATGSALRDRDLAWMDDGESVALRLSPDTPVEAPQGVTSVQVFKNGALTGGVDYVLSKYDTCKSIIEATGDATGVDAVHLADDPDLFDEGGLRLDDEDLGWLKDGAKLWIVPKHRYYHWPKYDIGTTIRIQHPESPIPGKQIELTMLSHEPKLLKIDNFLSEDEIDHLIQRAKDRLEQSVTGANADGTHSHRTSTNAWESGTPQAQKLIYRSFSIARVPYQDNQRDAIQILHYGKGDRYIVHTDWFSAGGYEGWNTSTIGNTNRYATVFFYLNDPDAGGHTVFPKATAPPPPGMVYNITQEQWDSLPEPAKIMDQCKPGAPGIHVPAKKGTAIIFYSSDPFGNLDPLSEHGACPVIDGEKWGANVWIWNYKRPPMKSNKKNPRAISFSFYNKREDSVDLSYSPGGSEPDVFFSTIEPGTQYSVTTYSGHSWVMRKHGEDEILHRYTVPMKRKGITQLDIL